MTVNTKYTNIQYIDIRFIYNSILLLSSLWYNCLLYITILTSGILLYNRNKENNAEKERNP